MDASIRYVLYGNDVQLEKLLVVGLQEQASCKQARSQLSRESYIVLHGALRTSPPQDIIRTTVSSETSVQRTH
eukprot:scaffold1019_cov97-Skeletonema_marinoi.AAC.18